MPKRVLNPLLTGLALTALIAAPSVASSAGPNPKAPPETAQFDFLVGDWECVIKTMKPDGSGYHARGATWRAEYILDGWAIQDWWGLRAAGRIDGLRHEHPLLQPAEPQVGQSLARRRLAAVEVLRVGAGRRDDGDDRR